MKNLQTKAFQLLSSKFGNEKQINKSIEELSELIQSLARYLNRDVKDGSHMDFDVVEVLTEIADVQIITDFLIRIFETDQGVIDVIKRAKLNKVIENNS